MSQNSPSKKIIVDQVPQNEPVNKRKSFMEKINLENGSKTSSRVFLNFEEDDNINDNDINYNDENNDIFDENSIFNDIIKEESNKNNSSLSQPIVGPLSKLRMRAKKLNFHQRFENDEDFNNENNSKNLPIFCSKRTYYK
jgi:hypothetical protein